MAAKVLNIEVGDELIKVCRVIKKGKEVHLADEFMFHTPAECVNDGVIEDPQTLALKFKDELAAHGLEKVQNANFTLSSGKIAIREVKLPPVKGKQLAAIVSTNAEEYFPVDLKNYHITYSLLETVSGQDPHSRVLVMAAPMKLLEGYFKLADLAGLNILSIDNSGNSHYQALKRLAPKNVTLYVNVDTSTSVISFMQGSKLLLQRTFSFGGGELISHYMTAAGKKTGEYLQAIEELDIHSPNFKAGEVFHTDDLQSDLSRLISSITRSVDYFNSNQWEYQAEKIVLMGPCRHLAGLCELVSDAAGLETIYLDDIHEFTAGTGTSPDAPSYVGCLGCAMAPLDFMPDRFLSKGKSKNKNESLTPGFVICGLLIVVSVAVSAMSILQYTDASKKLDSVNQEISDLQYAEDTYFTYLAYQQGQAAVESISLLAQQPNSKLAEFYEELEAKMPTSILLLSAICTNEGVSMSVTVGSYEEAAVVLKQLRSFESLTAVEISSVTRNVNEAGIERVEFTLNCTYGENPYLNGINPYEALIIPETTEEPAAAESAPTESPAQ